MRLFLNDPAHKKNARPFGRAFAVYRHAGQGAGTARAFGLTQPRRFASFASR